MKFISYLLILGIVLSLGCTSETTEPVKPINSPAVTEKTISTETSEPATPKPVEKIKEVSYIDLGIGTIGDNWDADYNIDGIRTTLYPHSADGGDVQLDGTVTFKLVAKVTKIDERTYNIKEEKIELQTWTTAITKDEGGLTGIDRRLEFSQATEDKVVKLLEENMGMLDSKV